jgi:perosamine synthetase
MTNIHASIGQAQVLRLRETLARNEAILELYREALEGISGVSFPPDMTALYEPVVWLTCVLVPPTKRDVILEVSRRAGIEMRPFFHSLSSMPLYARYATACPNSVALAESGLNLPTSRQVDRQVADRVARIFRKALF